MKYIIFVQSCLIYLHTLVHKCFGWNLQINETPYYTYIKLGPTETYESWNNAIIKDKINDTWLYIQLNHAIYNTICRYNINLIRVVLHHGFTYLWLIYLANVNTSSFRVHSITAHCPVAWVLQTPHQVLRDGHQLQDREVTCPVRLTKAIGQDTGKSHVQ